MMLRNRLKLSALLLLLPAALSAADTITFIQASDPQFGMYTENREFRQETSNWEFVIANVNRLHPGFLVETGDLTNEAGNSAQMAEYKRINGKLDPAIHLYSVAGNHDVGNEPTPESLAAYREHYGADRYSFREGKIYGIVLNSSLMKAPEHVAAEAAAQEKWLEQELRKAEAAQAMPVVFQHIPLFLETPTEADQYFNIPLATRARILGLLHKYNVHYVFAGHYHRNSFGQDGDLQMITTGPAGMPIGPDPSGFRIASVHDDTIDQKYYGLGNIPK